MARIIYSVCGEGMGHAVRSRPIIEHLKKKNDVKIFSSSRAYSYLSGKFDDVNEIEGLHINYKKNGIDEVSTLFSNILNFSRLAASFSFISREIKDFKPDIIISDFDIISAYAGLFKSIPTISIGNHHLSNMVKITYPKRYILDYLQLRLVNRLIIPKAGHYLVTSFFHSEPKSSDVHLVAPIIREEVLGLKRAEKDYILVYQTSDSNKKLIEELKKIDQRFIVYGFGIEKKDHNIVFRKFNENRFFGELAGCKALITNGGFTLISEALHLEKPILSIPIKNHFEQILNALYLERLGYGKMSSITSKNQIEEFMGNIENYKRNLRRYEFKDKPDNNSDTFKKLDSVINGIR
ncbi:hypothetical protein COV19_06365 [Candidatus Woesearchaeota archaeon CG10_big_fil_rev_8_21_14_0_10_44_13]|nr:MAG: hypothetical protein COV19_06365 [Candidatus Woesearchaeota archaeon CG10_big_fil_rev_8_21_14_0_10_44_13]